METKIDVENIMKEIRAEVERRKINETIIPFEEIPMYWEEERDMEFNFDELKNDLKYLNEHCHIQSIRPLRSRPIVGGFIILCKKILRKCLVFYIEPIVRDQNEFNAVIARSMRCIQHYQEEHAEMQEELAELTKKISMLELQISEYKAEAKKEGRI